MYLNLKYLGKMYTHKHLQLLLKRLWDLHVDPIKELGSRSGLTRPTVCKFLNGQELRPVNQSRLIEISLDIIEEGQAKRKALIQRSRQIIQFELELEQDEKNQSI